MQKFSLTMKFLLQYKYLLLSALSALLLSMPFFERFSGLWLMVAFVPLLLAEDDMAKHGKRSIYRWAALTFLLWNIITTYWIMYATFWGMVGAVTASSALEAGVFWLFSIVKRRTGKACGYAAFVVFWLVWEHFFLNSEISWPWLTLGNGFSKDILLIQWYDCTGALGGSLWALVCNVLAACFFHAPCAAAMRRYVVAIMLWVLLPMGISFAKYYTYKTNTNNRCRVAVLQPNIDPYNEKFDGHMPPTQQLNIMLQLAVRSADSATNYVIAPETALHGIWENKFASNLYIMQIRDFCKWHPQTRFITGATTFHDYGKYDTLPPSPTARAFTEDSGYYDVFNTAMQIDTSASVPVYHKSKLVVGVEMLPYPQYLKFLTKWAINLGGTSGGLGTQRERSVFANAANDFRPGVIICYESIYGEYCTDYVRNGANLLFIITNDGWWRNSPGHRQHLNYARLRAIETRRSIARSANTGISAIISQRGEILQRTQWWTRDAFSADIYSNDKITWYVRWGDYLARMAQIMALVILAAAFVPKKKLTMFNKK
jgi:apolipoprotein N-acyltransferase